MLRMFFSGILQISDTEIFTRVDRIIIISLQQSGNMCLKTYLYWCGQGLSLGLRHKGSTLQSRFSLMRSYCRKH